METNFLRSKRNWWHWLLRIITQRLCPMQLCYLQLPKLQNQLLCGMNLLIFFNVYCLLRSFQFCVRLIYGRDNNLILEYWFECQFFIHPWHLKVGKEESLLVVFCGNIEWLDQEHDYVQRKYNFFKKGLWLYMVHWVTVFIFVFKVSYKIKI